MKNLNEFQISKLSSVQNSFFPKFSTFCVIFYSFFAIPLFSNPQYEPSGPYKNYTYYKNQGGYSCSQEEITKVGYDSELGDTYRKALQFNIKDIPLEATITSCEISFSSGDECGSQDGTLKFTEIPHNWPTYWDQNQFQTVYDQIKDGTVINEESIIAIATYVVDLDSFKDEIQGVIDSGDSLIALGVYNQYEGAHYGTSFSNIKLRIDYTVPVPPAPTNLEVTSKTPGSITLQWSAPSGEVTNYRVLKNGSYYGSTPNTYKKVCNLYPGTYYTFTVNACNDYGCGDLSSPITDNTVFSSISGDPLICTTKSYSVNIIPTGSTITWNEPANLTLLSDEHANPVTYQKYSNGNGTITATISSSCENYVFTKQVHSGPYSSSDYPISGPSSAQCESWVSYSIPQLAGVTSINWVWPQEWTYYSGQGTRYLALITGQYSGAVMVGVNNECGQSGSYAYKYTSIYGYCGYFLFISPNPASDVVNVTINEPVESVTLTNDTLSTIKTKVVEKPESFKVIVTDNMGVIYYSATEYDKTFTLPVQKLRNGNYIIVVDYGKFKLSASLVVLH